MQRRVARDGVFGDDAVLLGRPVDEASARKVGEHDALRIAGRPRGVEDVREVLLRHLRVVEQRCRMLVDRIGAVHRHAGYVPVARFAVHHDEVLEGCGVLLLHGCPRSPLLLTGEDVAQPAVAGDVADSVLGSAGIERHVRRPRLHHAVDADHGFKRLAHVETDPVALLDTERMQEIRHLVGPLVELPIGQGPFTVDQRNLVRGAGRRILNVVVDQVPVAHSFN